MPRILILLIIYVLSSPQNASARTSCQPRTCNGLRIKNPFWISEQQEPLCGQLGFNISCDSNKPVMKIHGENFIIIDISYKKHSLMLAKQQVFDADNKCPTPQHNFTVNGTPFSYSSATSDLFFFYNCRARFNQQTYAVDCASNGTHHSFAVFHVELLRHWNYSVESCQPPVNSPVEDDSLEKLLQMNYTTILKKGFVLQWNQGQGSGLNSSRRVELGVGAAATTAVFTCVAIFILCRNKHRQHQDQGSSPCVTKDLERAGIRIFDYQELEEATDHFNPKTELGDGGYGAVYKGRLRDGRVVAVKRLYENHNKSVEQFTNEVDILARLRHQNLVSLYGCTSQYSKDLLLVYEYIHNGTLSDHLHGPRSSLSWDTRLNIAIETGSALVFLHASDVIHRDVKSSNILLDNDFTVKVADFGLSRLLPLDVTHVSTAPQGTPGYVDPEYNEFYQLTEKSDVYSFGVVLIELISSKPAVDITRKRNEINLSTMAISKIQSNALHELVDPYLGFDSDFKVTSAITSVAELAFRCLQNTKEMRPAMQDVLNVLEEIKSKDYSTRDVMEMNIPADDTLLLNNC